MKETTLTLDRVKRKNYAFSNMMIRNCETKEGSEYVRVDMLIDISCIIYYMALTNPIIYSPQS